MMEFPLKAFCITLVANACVLLCHAACHAEVIRLSTGEVLTVEVLESNDEIIRVRHAVLGELTLPRDSVSIVAVLEDAPAEAPPADAPPADADAAPAPPQPADAVEAPVAPAPPPKEWKFKLTFAGGASTGNSENINVVSIFTATRETEQLRTVFDAGYFYAESGDTRSENRFTAGARNDWLNPGSRWFYFGQARYDYDEFQSWDQRVAAHAGVGYKLVEPPDWRINLLAGLGAIKEFGSENDDVRPEGLLGVEGEWTISEKQSLKFDSTLFPDLSEIGEFRWVNNIAWSALIDEKTQLSLTAGLAHEYQSEVDPGRDKNDLRVFAGINLEF